MQESFFQEWLLSRLKYAGITKDDLLIIYKLFIKSNAEYCSVAFHSALAQEKTKKIVDSETSPEIILGSEYISYESALSICSLDTLFQRRSDRMLKFSIKCTQDKFNKNIFPLNTNLQNKEHLIVNFARTNEYLRVQFPNPNGYLILLPKKIQACFNKIQNAENLIHPNDTCYNVFIIYLIFNVNDGPLGWGPYHMIKQNYKL